MERWMMVGGVLLLTSFILLGSAAVGMGRPVVAEGEAHVHLNLQTLGPYDLPGGDLTVWLEDNPAWPEEDWPYDVLLRAGGDEIEGDIPVNPRSGDIKGVPCILIAMFTDVPEGEWKLALRFWVWERIDDQSEVWVFILSSPGTFEAVALAAGIYMAVAGAWVVVSGKWPEKRK